MRITSKSWAISSTASTFVAFFSEIIKWSAGDNLVRIHFSWAENSIVCKDSEVNRSKIYKAGVVDNLGIKIVYEAEI